MHLNTSLIRIRGYQVSLSTQIWIKHVKPWTSFVGGDNSHSASQTCEYLPLRQELIVFVFFFSDSFTPPWEHMLWYLLKRLKSTQLLFELKLILLDSGLLSSRFFLDPGVFMKDGSVCSCSHSAATTNRAAILYTCDHQMTLNADKCKVMNIDFKKN